MKVLILTALYHPYDRGGAETIVKKAVAGFLAARDKATVVTTEGWRSDSAVAKVVYREKVIRFWPGNLFWFGGILNKPAWLRLPWHLWDMFNLYSFFRVLLILKKERPDLICSHNINGLGYLTPLAVSYYLKKNPPARYLHTLHDVQLVNPTGRLYWGRENDWLQTNIFTRIYAAINRKLFSYCPMVVAPSRWQLDYYLKQGFFKQAKTAVVLNPLEISRRERNWPLIAARQKQEINFLFVGQVARHKGILFLAAVFEKIWQELNSSPKVKLQVVGQGDSLAELREWARHNQNLIIHGQVSNEKVVTELLPSADWLVVPSLFYENTPTVIFESLAAGVPVLASDLGGVGEIIENGKNGFRLEPGNGAVWQEKVAAAIKMDFSDYRKLGIGTVRLGDCSLDNYVRKIKELAGFR